MFETRDFAVGDDLRDQFGLEKNHPIILMPGIVSTGLESWSTETRARPWFRNRLWGTSTMIRVSTNKHFNSLTPRLSSRTRTGG
jgi:phospholipid:diacylglycerol acyltransferase